MQEAPWAVLRLQPLASSVCFVKQTEHCRLLLGWVRGWDILLLLLPTTTMWMGPGCLCSCTKNTHPSTHALRQRSLSGSKECSIEHSL